MSKEIIHKQRIIVETTMKEGCGKEVAIQTDAQEIDRNSGKIPVRKRFVPLKFSDYCVFANNVKEDDEEEDASFTVSYTTAKTTGDNIKRSRGRPRKAKEASEESKRGNDNREESVKKNQVLKVQNGFKCVTCGKIFSLRGNAKTHLLTHTDNKPFQCDFKDCGKQLRTKESLRRHKLSHLGIKLFECSECHKKFSCNLSLQEHMTLHTGEKRLSCEICGMKFRQVAVMKRHLITHSEDKPFSCEVCGKKFSLKIYVRSHMKTHTGEKPFSCTMCNKSFAHASDLNRHKIIHSGEKPYKCSICSMRYSDPSSRRRHEREHENKPQFVCHLCKKQFTRAGQLRGHLVKEHASPSFSSQGQGVNIPLQIKVETTQSQAHQLETDNMLSIIPNILAVPDEEQKAVEDNSHVGIILRGDKMETKSLLPDASSSQQFDPGKETSLVSIQHFIPNVQNAIQTFVMKVPKNSDDVTASLPMSNVYKIVEMADGTKVLELQLEDKAMSEVQDSAGNIAFTYSEDTITILEPVAASDCQEEHVNIIIENNPEVDNDKTGDVATNLYIEENIMTDCSGNPGNLLPHSGGKGEDVSVMGAKIKEQKIVNMEDILMSVS